MWRLGKREDMEIGTGHDVDTGLLSLPMIAG